MKVLRVKFVCLVSFMFGLIASDIDTIEHFETQTNDDGDGDSRYLDRHHVDCKDKALLWFRLIRPTTKTIAYEYYCGKESMGQPIAKTTNIDHDGNGNSLYLDRHKLDCDGKALLGFKLIRSKENSLQYQYTCGSKEIVGELLQKTTRGNIYGKGDSRYLDRHEIGCKNKPLSGFELYRPTEKTLAYRYSCIMLIF